MNNICLTALVTLSDEPFCHENPNRCCDEYLDGFEMFIEFVSNYVNAQNRIRC